ncbi:MAG: ComF family protein [Lachnospiraceae bacterium]|nr:ComF family protein [Lachnospiraceae bacterium]
MNIIWKKFCDLLFPPRCPICDQVRNRTEKGICTECSKKIKYVKEPGCMKCSKPLQDVEQEYCRDCESNRHYYVQGKALYEYGSVVTAIYRFKYKGRKRYGEVFGEEMALYLGEYIQKIGADALVPVPVHPTRERRRGYNQAKVLAETIGNQLNIPVRSDLIRRTRKTKALKTLNPKERLNNLKNAFILDGNGVKLNTIIIVDDIYTTGSTIDAMAKVFLESGVKKVYFVVLAIGEGC